MQIYAIQKEHFKALMNLHKTLKILAAKVALKICDCAFLKNKLCKWL